MNFAIDNPIGGTFSVVIKNTTGTTVYSATHGNETFDPGITTPGSYILYIDNEVGFCFDIPACECPPLTSATIILGGLTYSGLFSFTYDSPDDFCPFDILIRTEFTGGMFGTIPINSITDLVAAPSGVYTKTISLGGVGFMEYKIKTQSSDEICFDGTVTYDCVPPTIESVELGYDSELGYYIEVTTIGCGCGSYTINYTQTYPVAAFSGGASRVLDCEDLPDVFRVYINPTPDGAGRVGMKVNITDCCRGVSEYLLDVLPPCVSGPTIGLMPGGADRFILATGPVLAFNYWPTGSNPCPTLSCKSITVTYTQVNPGILGDPENVTLFISDVCASYPFGTITIPIFPNTSYPAYTGGSVVSGSGRALYAVVVTNCCGVVTTGTTP